MACFRGFEGNLDRFTIAHFADQNYFWRLPQGGTQGQGEGRRVGVEFALMNGGLFVIVTKLNRVLDTEDMNRSLDIGAIDNRRQGRRLSRAGRSSDQNDAI